VQQRANSLQNDLEREKVQKREAKGVSAGLALDLGHGQKELAEVKEALQREVVAQDNEWLAANLVYHDLGVPEPPEMSSLVVRITLILDHVRL
jgi:type III secretion system FlhB-like substrate exporter